MKEITEGEMRFAQLKLEAFRTLTNWGVTSSDGGNIHNEKTLWHKPLSLGDQMTAADALLAWMLAPSIYVDKDKI